MTFHRKLWELERTSLYSDAAYNDAAYSDQADAAYDDDDDLGAVEGVAARRASGDGVGSPSPAQRLASRTALRRRRQVFSGLLGGLLASLVAAASVGTPTAWALHAGVNVLFVTYISLLVRHHQRVVEQVAKVRYLSPIRAPRPAVVVLRSGAAR